MVLSLRRRALWPPYFEEGMYVGEKGQGGWMWQGGWQRNTEKMSSEGMKGTEKVKVLVAE